MRARYALAAALALLLAALPVAAQAAPKAGKWTAIAPAIDGPNAKHHTKIPFVVKGGAVRNFGVCGKKGACALAGGEACSLAGCLSCSALFELRGPVRIHGSSFAGVLKLAGGEILFKGTFTGATAKGTWEETGPLPHRPDQVDGQSRRQSAGELSASAAQAAGDHRVRPRRPA